MNQPTLDFGAAQLAEAPRSLSELKQWKCSECDADFPAKGNGRAKRCKDCRAKNPWTPPTKEEPCQRSGCMNTFKTARRKRVPVKGVSGIRRFCSHACRLLNNEQLAGKTRGKNGKLRSFPDQTTHCQECGKETSHSNFCTEHGKQQRRAVKMKHRKEQHKQPKCCELCGESWNQKTEYKLQSNGRACCGAQGKYCPDCRELNSRIEKFGVAHEPVSMLRLGERDRWLCGICDELAPQALLGTMNPNAPTKEHILAMSLGGAESYANCGISHRRCNSEKRDKIELEPRLNGVTDFSPFMIAKIPAKTQRDPFTLAIISPRAALEQRQSKQCACPCSEMFIPFINGNHGDFIAGHGSRMTEHRYAMHVLNKQRVNKEPLSKDAFIKRMQERVLHDARVAKRKAEIARKKKAKTEKALEQPKPKGTDSYNADLAAQEALYQSMTSQTAQRPDCAAGVACGS